MRRGKRLHLNTSERAEVHAEGYYSIEWRQDGKRRRVSVGKNAAQAQQTQEQKYLMLQAKARGLSLEERSPEVTLADACADFLDEIRQQRTPKTLAQIQNRARILPSIMFSNVATVDRTRQPDAPRTIWTKVVIVVQVLKAYGIVDLLKPRDWPRYVEKMPQAYTSEELRRFFEACDKRERVLFEFFLGIAGNRHMKQNALNRNRQRNARQETSVT